ncbi:MAG TPA: diguanylate cyclase [Treponemataceae bacterium]|nr:diguanylate cyclase [Treponemataceae bacterium]
MKTKGPLRGSLRLILICPFVVLVLMLTTTIILLSYYTARKATTELSDSLLRETAERIVQAVDRHIVGSGAALEAAFPNGMRVNSDISTELDSLRSRFWIATSLHTNPNNYVYYGNRAGQAFGVFRHPGNEGELRIKLKPGENRARYKFTGIDGALRFDSREDKLFDPRQRPWYIAGQTATTDTWTSVYIDFGTRELVATRARRVMGADGKVEGVVATDMSLKRLNDFVKSLKVSANGIAFIIEPNGDLIASSVGENVRSLDDGTNLRLTAAQSGNPFVEAAYAELRDRLSREASSAEATVFTFPNPKGGTIHASYATIKDQAGLDWITVVAMPSSDFLGSLTESLTRNIVIGIVATLLAIGMGLAILNWVAGDLHRLSLAARRFGDGELDASVGINRVDEIGSLARSLETMQTRLLTDRLTGIANREKLIRAISQKIRVLSVRGIDKVSGSFGILFIDLDGFKLVNDQLGHDMGDRVLVEIAGRLTASVRENDLVARYAGDEFVILLDAIATPETLESLRAHVEAVLQSPSSVVPRDATVKMGGSVGGALFPKDGTDAESLLKAADRHMYSRKFSRRKLPSADEGIARDPAGRREAPEEARA